MYDAFSARLVGLVYDQIPLDDCFLTTLVLTTSMESHSDSDIADLVKADGVLASMGTRRKIALLAVVCIADFLDTFSNSALFSAIPPICQQLGISNSDSVWLQSGYQLTFAALLLVVSSACYCLIPFIYSLLYS